MKIKEKCQYMILLFMQSLELHIRSITTCDILETLNYISCMQIFPKPLSKNIQNRFFLLKTVTSNF